MTTHLHVTTIPTGGGSAGTATDGRELARSFAPGALELLARLPLCPGESLLDVASGPSHLAIPAARAGVRVISTDVADAEALPYPDGRFDAAVTMFGAMFADRPERVVSELVRVTRPGGLVAMASWRSRGFFGGLLRTHTALLPPRPGVLQPLTLGDPDVVRGLLGERVATLISTRRTLALRFPLPPAATGELFAAWHEPTVAALRAGDSCGGLRLRAELARLITRHNRAVDGTTLLAGEYLEVQARLA